MIYLDHNSTTIVHPEVRKLIGDITAETLNPSSVHASGQRAKGLIEQARRQLAGLVGIEANARDYQVVFTSSGTEANNLVISNFNDGDIFISAIEHPSIFNYLQYQAGIKVIKVSSEGVIDLEDLSRLLAESSNSKKLVSVMLANNETGVIQPIKEVVAIATKFGAAVHSDCVQGVGKIAVDIKELGVDFATISGHKFGGALGAAALIAKTKYHLKASIIGGGQERGIRSGTENVPAIAGLGLAAKLAKDELVSRRHKMQTLQARLEQSLPPAAKIIGEGAKRLPNTSLVVVSGFVAETQVIAFDLKGIALSAGSACSSGKTKASHVLKAMNIPEDEASTAIRISLSHHNTEEEIDTFIDAFKNIYKLRNVA